VHPYFNSFENFYNYIGPRPDGMSIERIDNNGDYEPGNVRWATHQEQSLNLRKSRLITHQGKTQNVCLWAREIGISNGTLWARLFRYGWPVEKALTAPKMNPSQASALGHKSRWGYPIGPPAPPQISYVPRVGAGTPPPRFTAPYMILPVAPLIAFAQALLAPMYPDARALPA